MTMRTRPHPIITTILFGVALTVFMRTLCPTVYWEDAGELITVSHVLGIAHPPGHPLYTILGHVFTLLPLGTIAARVNFMSALFGALAAALVYPVVVRLLPDEIARSPIAHCSGATAALFAAFGLTLWDQSVVAETSTLHAFFFMMLMLLFIRMLRASDATSFSARLFLFGFTYGLSLTNHVAGVFLLPAFAVWAFVAAGRRLFSVRNVLVTPFFFFIGLSIYLYLPIRSAQDPVIDWGNPETLSNFLWVVTAGQFRGNVLDLPSNSQLVEGVIRHITNIHENFMGIGTVLILFGIWDAFRRRRDFLLFASVAMATLFLITLNPAFIVAYIIPAVLVLTVFLGLGVRWLASILIASLDASVPRRAAVAVVCIVMIVLPALPLIRHYPMNDRSTYFLARQYGMRILDSLPPNAAFFTIDLNAMFTMWYLIYCEGVREDVLVVEPTWLTNSDSMREELLQRYPQLLMPEVGETIVVGERLAETSFFDRDLLFAILRKNAEVRPVFWGAVPVIPSLQPCGLVYEFTRNPDMTFEKAALEQNAVFWEEIADEFQRVPALACDRVATLVYPENVLQQGMLFKRYGLADEAKWAFELASRMNPAYARAWLGLGELCMGSNEFTEALELLKHAARLDSRVRPRALFLRGCIFYELGRYGEAVAELEQLTEETPAYPDAHNMLGSLYLTRGEIDKAKNEFHEEIRLNPSTPTAYSNLAQTLINQSKMGEAERVLKAGIVANEDVWQNIYLMAVVEALKGHRAEAAEFLDSATALGGKQVLELAETDPVLRPVCASRVGEEESDSE